MSLPWQAEARMTEATKSEARMTEAPNAAQWDMQMAKGGPLQANHRGLMHMWKAG